MKRSRQQGKLLFKFLGVLAGLWLIVVGFQDRAALSRTLKYGKHAVVEPIKQYTETKRRGSSTYKAEIRFKTESGQQIVINHSIPAAVLDDFKAHRPVQVAYLTKDPHTFRFVKEEPTWITLVAGLAILLAALLLL